MQQSIFEKQKVIGKTGESAIYKYYRDKDINIIDVSEIPKYQVQEIDFLIKNQSVEVKTNNRIYTHNQITLEIIGNIEKQKQGWFSKSKAEVIIFYSPQENKMYQFLFQELRKYYKENETTIQHRIYKEHIKDNLYKSSLLAYIDIDELKQSDLNMRVYSLSE